ncbi:unnamed protein product [Soboliphyme baturini]|uniref:Calponin-homology (CH) domain-containing protein n=1 Tax=Soboliphyme baturini TaxID=241478 RepID=A0A183IHP8_9BILA|nr:unnamed protein product [Soboliphyme baturini]
MDYPRSGASGDLASLAKPKPFSVKESSYRKVAHISSSRKQTVQRGDISSAIPEQLLKRCPMSREEMAANRTEGRTFAFSETGSAGSTRSLDSVPLHVQQTSEKEVVDSMSDDGSSRYHKEVTSTRRLSSQRQHAESSMRQGASAMSVAQATTGDAMLPANGTAGYSHRQYTSYRAESYGGSGAGGQTKVQWQEGRSFSPGLDSSNLAESRLAQVPLSSLVSSSTDESQKESASSISAAERSSFGSEQSCRTQMGAGFVQRSQGDASLQSSVTGETIAADSSCISSASRSSSESKVYSRSFVADTSGELGERTVPIKIIQSEKDARGLSSESASSLTDISCKEFASSYKQEDQLSSGATSVERGRTVPIQIEQARSEKSFTSQGESNNLAQRERMVPIVVERTASGSELQNVTVSGNKSSSSSVLYSRSSTASEASSKSQSHLKSQSQASSTVSGVDEEKVIPVIHKTTITGSPIQSGPMEREVPIERGIPMEREIPVHVEASTESAEVAETRCKNVVQTTEGVGSKAIESGIEKYETVFFTLVPLLVAVSGCVVVPLHRAAYHFCATNGSSSNDFTEKTDSQKLSVTCRMHIGKPDDSLTLQLRHKLDIWGSQRPTYYAKDVTDLTMDSSCISCLAPSTLCELQFCCPIERGTLFYPSNS